MNSIVSNTNQKVLFEISWEVCNQVGGIYSSIRSKIPAMLEKWDDRYFMIGPYLPDNTTEFEPIYYLDDSPVCCAIQKLRSFGFDVHYGYWLLLAGRPKVILFDIKSVWHCLETIRAEMKEITQVWDLSSEEIVNQILAFGEMVYLFLSEFLDINGKNGEIVAHFHEWMAGGGLIKLYEKKANIATVFTTHATLLGRYLAQNDPNFRNKIDGLDWYKEAQSYGIETQASLERMSAQSAGTFTAVSEIIAQECIQFLGRVPDLISPNGIEVSYLGYHEQVHLHHKYRKNIDKFIMSHFFPSYSFNLSKTLYFFTSGRFEYKNKGFDLTIDAIAFLNKKMKMARMDTTVVLFIITNQPIRSVNASVLHSHMMLNELEEISENIRSEVGSQLFRNVVASDEPNLPDLNDFVSEYAKYKRTRTILSWKNKSTPSILTHDLYHDDEIVDYCRQKKLQNSEKDKVKVVYHPEFIKSSNPLFGIEYDEFVSGCNLGVFPSFYEPWGYTPQECVIRGVPTISSNLSGFGDHISKTMKDHDSRGIYVLNRKTQSYQESVEQLTDIMFRFVKRARQAKVIDRNLINNDLEKFTWNQLKEHYDTAHELAFKRKKSLVPKKKNYVYSKELY